MSSKLDKNVYAEHSLNIWIVEIFRFISLTMRGFLFFLYFL